MTREGLRATVEILQPKGFGRVALMETAEHKHSTTQTLDLEHAQKMRITFEIMDYSEPEPNTNPKNGGIFTPPSSTPAPPPRA
ncbi:putative transmembrane protein [Sesbania bispinosa]|nr:putative transmembrane protein [Sesbania bispinosa]